MSMRGLLPARALHHKGQTVMELIRDRDLEAVAEFVAIVLMASLFLITQFPALEVMVLSWQSPTN